MSTTSVKPLDTLKGVFSAPKMDRHRRNFLKENKLSLRELQRVTSKIRQTQQQEQQQREQKFLNRRSMSQQRGHVAELKASVVPRYPSCTRVLSSRGGVNGTGATAGRGDGRGDGAIGSVHGSSDSFGRFSRRGITRTGSTSTIVSCDKQIQTEDIRDEEFLVDALKKCEYRSNGLQPNLTRRSRQSASILKHTDRHVDTESKHSQYEQEMEETELQQSESDNQPYETDQYQQSEEEPEQNYYDEQQPQVETSSKYNFPPTIRSQQYSTQSYNENGNDAILPGASQYETEQQYHPQRTQHQATQRAGVAHEDLRSNFENLALNNNACDVDNPQQPHSGRSRRTNFSHSTQHSQHGYELSQKRSTGSVHKLGCRDDVRLPRYLEREKREKEELRQRERDRDTNCPAGHYALPESDRLAALKTAETRFKALISELNRMPMTTETLRMRNRKAEIEKELKLLETDIRIFSKLKVYVKHND